MKRRLSIFIFYVALFGMTLLFIKCKKEYSYEGGLYAIYEIIGSPDACDAIKINGNYVAGEETDSSNNIEVNVNVTTAGKYSINTSPVDGLSFSTSGEFEDTGVQKVVLKCSGKVKSSGDFKFIISGITSCYFSLHVKDMPVEPSADFTFYGSPNDCENPAVQGNYKTDFILVFDNTVTVYVLVNTVGPYNITTNTVNGISFSGSGKFTTTGIQQVTLKGKGTPILAGQSKLTLDAGVSKCGFTVVINSSSPTYGPATYVLTSDPGAPPSCSGAKVNGKYISNIPLDSSNSIEVQVYATIPGTYSISTNSEDGISFTNSGTFMLAGGQSVLLYGTGTPQKSDTIQLVPQIAGPTPIGGGSCGVSIDVL